MKILLPIKTVIDYNSQLKIKNNKIDKSNLNNLINPYDEIAIEEAVRLKEKGLIKNITAVSCGDLKSKEILYKAMAMGVDSSILIKTSKNLQPLFKAKILKYIINKEKPNLVFLGKQSIDSENCQVGQILASLLNWPKGFLVSKIFLKKDKILINQEIENGIEKISLSLPAIIIVDLKLNEPRYINIINIIKAKKKNISIIKLKSLNINCNSNIKLLNLCKVPKKKNKLKILSVNNLIKKIKNEILNI